MEKLALAQAPGRRGRPLEYPAAIAYACELMDFAGVKGDRKIFRLCRERFPDLPLPAAESFMARVRAHRRARTKLTKDNAI